MLIYGAGDGGELLVRELQNNFQLGLTPVGFLDDDPQKHGRVIHGLRVFGSVERLGDLATAGRWTRSSFPRTRSTPAGWRRSAR